MVSPQRSASYVKGDIIGIDCGAIVDGYYGDHAVTFAIGAVTEENQKLLHVTRPGARCRYCPSTSR